MGEKETRKGDGLKDGGTGLRRERKKDRRREKESMMLGKKEKYSESRRKIGIK